MPTFGTYRCDCGDTECFSCGLAQGTLEDELENESDSEDFISDAEYDEREQAEAFDDRYQMWRNEI